MVVDTVITNRSDQFIDKIEALFTKDRTAHSFRKERGELYKAGVSTSVVSTSEVSTNEVSTNKERKELQQVGLSTNNEQRIIQFSSNRLQFWKLNVNKCKTVVTTIC